MINGGWSPPPFFYKIKNGKILFTEKMPWCVRPQYRFDSLLPGRHTCMSTETQHSLFVDALLRATQYLAPYGRLCGGMQAAGQRLVGPLNIVYMGQLQTSAGIAAQTSPQNRQQNMGKEKVVGEWLEVHDKRGVSNSCHASWTGATGRTDMRGRADQSTRTERTKGRVASRATWSFVSMMSCSVAHRHGTIAQCHDRCLGILPCGRQS